MSNRIHNRRLTDDQVRAIRNSNLSTRKLAAQYNVSHITITRVKRREYYKNVVDKPKNVSISTPNDKKQKLQAKLKELESQLQVMVVLVSRPAEYKTKLWLIKETAEFAKDIEGIQSTLNNMND